MRKAWSKMAQEFTEVEFATSKTEAVSEYHEVKTAMVQAVPNLVRHCLGSLS
jgi:hypothetical protein